MAAQQSPDLVVLLGDFAFDDTEIPERINFGGKQSLAVHELVGGTRVVDAMGAFDSTIQWSGLLRGPNAVARARRLDALRSAGVDLVLSWHEMRYTVVIESFEADFERFYQIPYRISCLPVGSQGIKARASDFNVDTQVRSDMGTVSTVSGLVGDSTLTGLVGTLSGAVSSVSDFAKSTTTTLNSVLQPLAAVQTQVNNLITSVGNTVSNVTTLGGVAPGNPIAQQASRLTGTLVAMNSLPQLYNLRSVLGRMSTNLNTAGNSGQFLNTAGGNLYQVASQQYGDPTAWTVLAKANGVTDPQVQGLKTLNIPPAPSGAAPVGGVLSA
jgi:hypothetical protein